MHPLAVKTVVESVRRRTAQGDQPNEQAQPLEILEETILELARQRDRDKQTVDALLNHCPDMECSECARIVCPHAEPMHFHHDGCPACSSQGERSDA